jgi:peroxiredoxin
MTRTPIADEVAALHAGRPESAFSREQDELARRDRPDLSARVGHPFPTAELLDPHGAPTSLEAAAGGAPAVVILYRGSWCPYCNVALRVYQRELVGPLTERGVRLVAISPQRPDGSLSMQEKNELDFAVLSDPGNRIAEQLGVVTQPDDDARELQLEHGLDVTAANADGTLRLPMPTTAILDADGVLRWIEVRADYTTRTEPEEILARLDGLGL